MTTILPADRSPWEAISRSIGEGLSQTLPQAAMQRSQRENLQQSLAGLKNIATSGGSPLDVTLAAMQAGAGIPGSERYLGQIIPMLQQLASANASQNAPMAGEVYQNQVRNREPIDQIQPRQSLPERTFGQSNQFFPENIGPQGGPGNVPQEATQRAKEPLLSTSQYPEAAKKLAKERTAAGIPTTAREALEEIKENERAKKTYNEEIDKELEQRVEGQKNYGQRALDYLENVYPKASDEVKAIFQKKGEEASRRGDSEADINRYLANEAKIFKNAIVNAENEVSAPRLFENLMSKINGNYKNFEKAASDIRKHLQPLIDLGLYDTARGILQKKGYGVEEREAILNPLNNRSQSIINQLPLLRHSTEPKKGFKKPEANLNEMTSIIMQLQNDDPNFSPVLARKKFLDKGYDWKDFSNAWNEALKQGFKPTPDQANQSGYLDHPPLNLLDELLQGITVGR